jgi:manganese/zinc/iron transport system permease protein
MTDALWIILAGSLAAVACATLGCFLVLRNMAMLADAISHAVLPGIVLAFFLTGSRAALPMVLGAGAVGLLTALAVETLHRAGGLRQDTSIGVAFTWMFAVGVILVSAWAGQVDLDQDCVLYGEIAYVPLDTWRVGTTELGPRAVWLLGAVCLADLAFLCSCYKELKICAFDPALARAIGVPVGVMHYLLMGAVSATTVAAFESVGAILVVAMMVAPACTAYLLTDRLSAMLAIAAATGVACAAGGYALAHALDCSIAGAMASAGGALFALAFFFSPRRGVATSRYRRARTEPEPAGGGAADPAPR